MKITIKSMLTIWIGSTLLLATIAAFIFGVNVEYQEFKIYAARQESEAAIIKAESLKKIRICIAEAAEERAVHMARAQTETKRLVSNSLSIYEGFKLWLFSGLFEDAFKLSSGSEKPDNFLRSMKELDNNMDSIDQNAKGLLNSMKGSMDI